MPNASTLWANYCQWTEDLNVISTGWLPLFPLVLAVRLVTERHTHSFFSPEGSRARLYQSLEQTAPNA